MSEPIKIKVDWQPTGPGRVPPPPETHFIRVQPMKGVAWVTAWHEHGEGCALKPADAIKVANALASVEPVEDAGGGWHGDGNTWFLGDEPDDRIQPGKEAAVLGPYIGVGIASTRVWVKVRGRDGAFQIELPATLAHTVADKLRELAGRLE